MRSMMKRELMVGSLLIAALNTACEYETESESEETAEVEQAAGASYKVKVQERTLQITGTAADSRVVLRLQSSTVLAVDVGDDGTAEFLLDRATFDRILVKAGGGDDFVRIDESNGAFTHEEQVTIKGGAGNDTLLGGFGAETFQGGKGDDVIDGGLGSDTVMLGAGDDTFVWDPGDASDVIEGGGGTDRLVFHASNAGELVELSEAGGRLRLLRNIGTVTLDAGGVELVEIDALGGEDQIVVKDLGGTSVTRVDVDLAYTLGTGDGLADKVIVEGTAGTDVIDVAADGPAVVATGLAAVVAVASPEPALDALVVAAGAADQVGVNGSAGADAFTVTESVGHAIVSSLAFGVSVDASGMGSLLVRGLGGDDTIQALSGQGPLPIRLEGGDGNDEIFGGFISETIVGGAGDDLVDGGGGADVVELGDGDDTFVWNPGGGSDVVEGEAGADRLLFNGANIGETIQIGASAERAHVSRNIGTVSLDAGSTERIEVAARGGADQIVVGDLGGTPVTAVSLDLGATPQAGLPDGALDVVTVRGSSSSDSMAIDADGSAVVLSGLVATVTVGAPDPLDQLVVDGLGENDTLALGPGVDALLTVLFNQD
jgi:Ca2+-binding RTX toxin-like protein